LGEIRSKATSSGNSSTISYGTTGKKGIAIEALSGIDIALWDIKGKATGLPVSVLLGGCFRTQVQAYATGFYRQEGLTDQADNMAREADDHVRRGFGAMKLKLGFGVEEDQRCVRAVRQAVGDRVRLMADANHAYDASSAIRLGRTLEQERYEWFEEPVTPEDIEGYQQIHAALDIAIEGAKPSSRGLVSRHC
jgi:D-galactarolactone cycloisomerase